ncbi:MAG: lipid-A-disaccharide synthase [Kiritimatiellae bacterium]|nr:lipid-A-disaccharide synthase [Kiritimatiellia bacterium]
MSSLVPTSKNVLIIAGETSGDLHGARVVEAVRRQRPEINFFGIGGDALRAAGTEVLVDAREMAVLGLWEVLKRYSFFRRVFGEIRASAVERKPDLALLIDYPGFNLRLAAELKKLNIPVLYYVCPQVWAWHRSRIQKMAQIIDRLLVIFPFEVDAFSGTGLRVEYVGHPLVDEAARVREGNGEPIPWPSGTDPEGPRIALLPGSRKQEIERILPTMWVAAGLVQQAEPSARFILAAPSSELAERAHALGVKTGGGPTHYSVVVGQTRRVLAEATAAWVKSGTSTVEAALMKCPMSIVYKTSPITYFFGKRLIRVPHLGMVNLILEREAFGEFIQHEATPARLAEALLPLLRDTPERAASLLALDEIEQRLGVGGAAVNVAKALIEELDAR